MILIFFCGGVLLEVHPQHPFQLFASGEAGLEALILQAFLDAGEVGAELRVFFLCYGVHLDGAGFCVCLSLLWVEER